MQSVLDESQIRQGLMLEIRSPWSSAPPFSAELARCGITLLEESRVLSITGDATAGWNGELQLGPEQRAVLADGLIETISTEPGSGTFVDVFTRPGVTDAEGAVAERALALTGMIGVRCAAGLRYRFAQPVAAASRPLVERQVGNGLIHRFAWSDGVPGVVVSPVRRSGGVSVRTIPVRGLSETQLLELSHDLGLALDVEEMEAVRAHFSTLGREPTDAELESIALTWSEHCSHKTFKATIQFEYGGRHETIPGLLRACIADPSIALDRSWVHSAFADNAGLIAFDGRHDLAFKVETHNHPSALEPFGGAHTGVGGVIRDVLAMSAQPIANTDVLCFGPLDAADGQVPAGAFHPRTTFREVVRGVADYGNNMGIPTVGGAVLFHPGYMANPLVYCGTLGLLPTGSHPSGLQPGDRVVLLGGRTGRDGLHGATMSSETLDRESVSSSTVQIGAPITEKTLRDVIPRLRDEQLYRAITDCGAGGLCSAVGEMGAETGVEVDLALVPCKYDGLSPWEIWLSEAQERMVLAVAEDDLPRLAAVCDDHEVEVSVLGSFRGDGRMVLQYDGHPVADLAMSFLHEGRPPRTRVARWHETPSPTYRGGPARDAGSSLLTLLAHPTIASKESVIRRYDHEVQGATVIKPLTERGGPSDAAVVQPLPHSNRGAALAHGINPLYGALDPYAMALLTVDEALRNLVAVGGTIDEAALLDNFCWGDVDYPEGLGGLVRAAQGCRDAVSFYGTPFISGKDSLRNTSTDETGRHSIPPTLLISALGVIDDIERCVTMDLKAAGSTLYLLGETADELGGSHYSLVHDIVGGAVPQVRPTETPLVMRRLHRAIGSGLVRSCHDLSEGGLAVAAAEMALAGNLGLDLMLDTMPGRTEATEALLFAESPGRFLVEVDDEHRVAFENLVHDLPHAPLGTVRAEGQVVIRFGGEILIDLPVERLDRAWRAPLDVPTSSGSGNREMGEAHGPVSPHAVGDSSARAPGGRRPASATNRALVLSAPGVNCDGETIEACRLAGLEVEAVGLNHLLEGRQRFDDFGLLVLPGGFSYGDHLGAGALLAATLRHRLLPELQSFVASGRPVLGICNGFQVLARLGLLGDMALAANETGMFECRWVRTWVEPSQCIFLQDMEGEIELPVAHGQGRVIVLEDNLAEVTRRAPLRYRDNPNGSVAGIAGVCNEMGTVFGLMPHPERAVSPRQHPGWTRRPDLLPAGLQVFTNAARYLREGL